VEWGSVNRIGANLAILLTTCVLAVVGFITFAGQEDAKYEGVTKCKNCHEEPDKGNQYMKWKESKHAVAYESLASEDSREIAKKKGIDDPQKSDKCLKCHVTAFGVSGDALGKKFDAARGVQCESCHGPGGTHVAARLEAAAAEDEGDDIYGLEGEGGRTRLPEGEIVFNVEEETCLSCHNIESPTYKEFKFEESKKEIEHPDPRPRPE
jgi:hypothetical protein